MVIRLLGFFIVLSLTSCGVTTNTTIVSSSKELPMTTPSSGSYSLSSLGTQKENSVSYDAYNLIDKSQSPEEKMRVLIKRQSSNPTWLIHLHGGPGSVIRPSALHFLYNSYNVVYFQQRGSGSSSGPSYCDSNNNCVNPYTMLSSMFMDLAYLIDVIKKTDPKSKIVLFGESWGVYYGLLYMAIEQDPDVSAMIFDSGSALDIDANFLASAEDIKNYDWESIPTGNRFRSTESTSLRNDFSVLQAGVSAALNSNESSLDKSSGNDFINFYNTLNDYIMNSEYMIAAKANIQPPFTSTQLIDVGTGTLNSYPGPMDWDQTLSSGGAFVGIGDETASSYFGYDIRFSYWQDHASIFVASLSTSKRGTSQVISPLLFDIQGILDHYNDSWENISVSKKILFLYGNYDFRFRYSVNSGSKGICRSVLSHFNQSSDVGACTIKDPYDSGHGVISEDVSSHKDIISFLEGL